MEGMLISINNKKVKVMPGMTVIQACQSAGIEIPRFCYHEKLSIAGNCGMCLVEVEKSLKPVASCAMPVNRGMNIFTDSELVGKAGEGVMELLLINHPLDCPICDQGGECDLQDQSMVFGNDRGRFYEYRRAVSNKNCGPLIKTIMTRCIHCTRCVRFMRELGGMEELGVTGRGNTMEIGTYVNQELYSEVSGNIIDLCPVGALTSKPYAFVARSWELNKIESIDIFDGMGNNVEACIRGTKLLRMLPHSHEGINEDWMTDKAGFSYDGFLRQGLTSPLVKKNGSLEKVSWGVAFDHILRGLYRKDFLLDVILGEEVDLETGLLVKSVVSRYGKGQVGSEGELEGFDDHLKYTFNDGFSKLEESNFIVLLGVNLRVEAPLLAVGLGKMQLKKKVEIVSFGISQEQYLKITQVGNSLRSFASFLEGKHKLCGAFINSRGPELIVGLHGLVGVSNKNLGGLLSSFVESLNVCGQKNITEGGTIGLNYLHLGPNAVGLAELGLLTGECYFSGPRVLLVIEGDSIEVNRDKYDFIIYQGSHGDMIAEIADVILPSATILEKESSYLNMEGRLQLSKYVFNPPGLGRQGWMIVGMLLENLFDFSPLKFNSLEDVRSDLNLRVSGQVGGLPTNSVSLQTYKGKNKLEYGLVRSYLYNYYLTNTISRASKIMGICSQVIKKFSSNYRWK